MIFNQCDESIQELVSAYVALLRLPTDALMLTTSRKTFREWTGRSALSVWGGAYCCLPRTGRHVVLVNLDRIDRTQPRAVEIVIAEELVHMRDHLDGDRRRHAHHGYDRIAHRVSALVGVSLEEIRSALLPIDRRPLRYQYRCPGCGVTVGRRRRGTWSCARCAPRFDRRFHLLLIEELQTASTDAGGACAGTIG